MMPARSFARLAVAAFLPVLLGAQAPPQALPILKKIGTELVKKALTPSLQVEQFTLGGIKATEVDCDSGATPEAFSGTALFALPAPLGPRKLAFKGLVLKGTVAEGALDEPLKDFSATHQGWTYQLTRVVLSDQGSRVEGTATLAGLRLEVDPLALTPQGLQGTLSPGDLPLAEGPFTAELREGEVVFSPGGVKLKGRLEVRIAPPVRHGFTGAGLLLDGGAVAFDSALLAGSGPVAPNLATDLPLHHRGLTWIVAQTAFGFERGTPVLGGPTRLRFPLDTFCRAGATDQPYLSEALPCHLRGRAPQPVLLKPSGVRVSDALRPAAPVAALTLAWEGFSGSFPLPLATLHPSGLTAFRFEVQKGFVRVEKGRIDPAGSRVTGKVAWGPGFSLQSSFTEAVADLSEGLYVKGSGVSQPAEAGAYRIYTVFGTTLCDFSTTHSPEGLPAAWKGVFLPSFQVALPGELYTLNTAGQRLPVLAPGQAGRFEGNGTFSGALGVKIAKRVLLYFAPVQLEAFELQFQEGALISGPLVKGTLHLVAEPLLTEAFQPPLSFRLTQNGVEQVEVHTRTEAGPMIWATDLIGIQIALESARLHPSLLDMTGQFDFAIQGAEIPSVTFDHLVLEASGGPLEGVPGPIVLAFKGSRWSALPDRPSVRLWGFPFTLGESGYGTLEEPAGSPGRFYVGLGGDIEANPILPTLSNRLLFTTENKKATVVLESPYAVDQDIPALGSLKGALGFHVQAAADQSVSDAYFEGDAKLKLKLGDGLDIDGGMRFGRAAQGGASFPYFYALGHLKTQGAGVTVAPNFEIYGLLGGLAQNFLPDDIRATDAITGKTDPALGLAVMAGVDAGTLDRFTLDAYLDLYLSQNLTTVLQGKGWLLANRGAQPPDRQVSADIRFTRDPDTFHATLDADLNLYPGIMRAMGRVELHFGPDAQFLHLGTKAAPITVRFLDTWEGWGYMTVDWQGGSRSFGAGGGVSYRKSGGFGILYGEAWLTAGGDLLIEVDSDGDPRFLGTVAAEGGARFGMKFKTYKTHKITIFSGSLGTNLAFQAPGRPTFSGTVTLRYRVLGGLFKGSVSAHLDL